MATSGTNYYQIVGMMRHAATAKVLIKNVTNIKKLYRLNLLLMEYLKMEFSITRNNFSQCLYRRTVLNAFLKSPNTLLLI